MGFKPGLLNSQVIRTLGQLWKAEWKRNLPRVSMPFPPPDNTVRDTGLAPCLPPSLMTSWVSPDRFKTVPGQQGQAGVSRGLPGPFALFSLLTHSLALTTGVRVGMLPAHARKGPNLSSPAPFPTLSTFPV